MNCKKCGFLLTTEDKFCRNCGQAVDVNGEVNQQSNIGMYQQQNNDTSVLMNNNQSNYSMNMENNQNYSMGMNSSQQNYSENNTQPTWNNYNNIPSNQQNSKKFNGNLKYILIGLAIVIGIFVTVVVIKSSNNKSGNIDNSNQVAQSTTNYKVNFGGFEFKIPDNLIYEIDDSSLSIGDEQGTWAAVIAIKQGSFSQLQANKSQLQSAMQQSGYESSAAQEKSYGGVNYITMEMSFSGENIIAAYAKLNSMYVVGICAMNQDNEYDYNILEEVAPIIKSAQYIGEESHSINAAPTVDMSNILELAK